MNSSDQAGTAPRRPRSPAAPAGADYSRFIPREELRSFAAWRPGSFGNTADLVPAAWAPAASSAPAAATHSPPADPQPSPARPQARRDEWRAELQAELRAELQAELQAEWQADTARQVAAARTQGYQDGYRDGLVALDSFKQSFAVQASGQISQVVHALDQALGELEQRMAISLAQVATELARQVVRSELSLRPALVAQVAREAVNTVLASARQISLLVHPDDHALVAAGCQDALAARGARLLALASIQRGGCRVESDAGVVDAGIAARWAQATQALGTGVAWDDPAAAAPRSGGNA